MTGTAYPATPLLRRLTAAHGWRHELVRDTRGEPVAVVAVRIGPTWTDSVAITGENETLAMRHRTKVTKGPGSRAAGLAMAFKLIEAAQARWRAVNAPHLVALVRAGARFEAGKLVERPDGQPVDTAA